MHMLFLEMIATPALVPESLLPDEMAAPAMMFRPAAKILGFFPVS